MATSETWEHFRVTDAVTWEDKKRGIMPVTNVTTLTVQAGGWDDMVENCKKAKAILERHGGRNVRLMVPVSGGGPSGTAHTTFEADDLAGVGKVLDGIYADPEMIAVMAKGAETSSWESSILVELPLD